MICLPSSLSRALFAGSVAAGFVAGGTIFAAPIPATAQTPAATQAPAHVAAAAATDAILAEIQDALGNGDAAQAGRMADKALQQPGVPPLSQARLLLDRGLARELEGNAPGALADFTASLDIRVLPPPERAQALLQRGFLLDSIGRMDDAALDYGAVIALQSPSTAIALNNRANIRRRQNRLADAKRDYLAALGAGTDKPQFPYYGLGQVAEAEHKPEEARGFYAKAVAADPGYRLAADRLAALGGPLENGLSEPDQIDLHPPAAKPIAKVNEHAANIKGPYAPRPARGPRLRPALDGPPGVAGPAVQLGAWRSETEAQAGWERAKAAAGDLLDGLQANIEIANLPVKGRYFRLRVSAQDPDRLCDKLRKAGLACLQVHN